MLDLGRSLTARVGGVAAEVFAPKSIPELVDLLTRFREEGRQPRLLGGGSNVIAAEGDHDEPFVLTRHVNDCQATSETTFHVEAGANLTSLCHRTARDGLHGLECCTGIPGTFGAAVRINAGGKYGTVADVVREVTVLKQDGSIEQRQAGADDFSYRSSAFFDEVVLAAEVELERHDARDCVRKVKQVLKHKRTTQPLRYPSAGCIFRNPPGDSAGRLIDAAGLKETRVGGAMVSPLHANYIVNVNAATGSDFLGLIELVRQTVGEEFDVELELEVEVWK